MSSLVLRGYQAEACNAIAEKLAHFRSTLLCSATGTGKTVIIAETCRRQRDNAMGGGGNNGRVLVLAHREELIQQACDKIQRFVGLSTAVEMGNRRVDTLYRPDVVVGSVQTLSNKARRERFSPDEFDLIIVDEAHHATAKTYRSVLDYFTGAKVFGVTATPDRMDGTGLGEVFQSVAFVYEIRDAIQDGWLVPVKQRTVTVESLDLSRVHDAKNGDLNEDELEQELLQDQVLHEMAVPTIELAKERKTIVFTTSVKHAMALADVMNNYRGGCAVAVSGGSSKDARASALQSFTSGNVQFLVNCSLFTEGFDAPEISCVSIARPTKSRALYAQMVGRGTRILGKDYTESVANGKSDVIVLDLVGNAGKHSLVNCADILDGNKDANVRAKALDLIKKNPDKSVLEALDEADRWLLDEARRKVQYTARYNVSEVDPFVVLGASNRAGRWGGIAATDKQVDTLKRNGIDASEFDKGQASALIDKIVERSHNNLCTYKQARLLARHGLNPDVSFAAARRAIDAIAANNWKVPDELRTDPELRARKAA